MLNQAEIVAIAEVVHQAQKRWNEKNLNLTQKDWEDAEEWQRNTCIDGVKFFLENPDAPPSASHDEWASKKIEQGWKFGLVKDEKAKTHPCLVTFDNLPLYQQKIDILFKAIVNALK